MTIHDLLTTVSFVIHDFQLEIFLTGAPPSDDIPVERSPVYSAGPEPPTAAPGGDGVAVLESSAYSLSTDLQPALVSQPRTAATDGEGQQRNDEPID